MDGINQPHIICTNINLLKCNALVNKCHLQEINPSTLSTLMMMLNLRGLLKLSHLYVYNKMKYESDATLQ